MATIPYAHAVVMGTDATGQAQLVGISPGVQATQVLTLSGNAVNGETVTINGRPYFWVTVLSTTVEDQVLIGAAATNSIDNLIAAINHDPAQDGIIYSFGTAINDDVSAATGAGDTMAVTALNPPWPGATGNTLAVSETMSSGSWGGATLADGTYGSLNIGGGSGTLTLTSTARTPSISVASSDGSVTAGAQSVYLLFSTNFSGTVLEAAIDPASIAGLGFQANGNDTLGAIAYTISAGTITIAKIV